MLTIYPHESGLAWSSYLIDKGRINQLPKIHLMQSENSQKTLCGKTIGRYWAFGDDEPIEPNKENYSNFEKDKLMNCKKCAQAFAKIIKEI
jgi:hypothetical protein